MPSKDVDDDLEEELLAMTGGGGSSKKKKTPAKKKSRKRDSSSSDDDDVSSSSESDSDDEPKRRSSSSKGKASSKKRKVSSDEESDDERFDDGYDQDFFAGESDRQHLLSLPEIQREEILAERYNRRKELREQWELKRKLKRDKSSKEKSSSRSTKLRNQGASVGKASALSDLKKRRAKATSSPSSSRSRKQSDDEYDSDYGDEEEDKDDDYRKSSRKKKDVDSDDDIFEIKEDKKSFRGDDRRSRDSEMEESETPITLEQLNKICLRRDYLEKKVDEPYFDEMVLGFYVRIGIGTHNDRPVYRVAVVSGVKEGTRPYNLGKKKVTKYLMLQHGTSTKQFSMEHISNQRVSDSEFSKWMSEMDKNYLPIMSTKEADEKYESFKKYQNYVYSETDIQKMVEKKRKTLNMPLNAAAEKLKLSNLLLAAKENKNQQEIDHLNAELKKLEEKIREDEIKKATVTDKATIINQRNKEQSHTQKYDVAGEITIDPDLDPFSRRRTKPSNYLKKDEDGNIILDGNGVKKFVDKNAPHQKPKILRNQFDPESILRSAHDFDLNDLSIEDILPPPATLGQPKVDASKANRKLISLDDYKRRRGLI